MEVVELSVILRERIIDEIFFALGLTRTGWARQLFGRFFHLPAGRFGRIMAKCDRQVIRSGLSGAARWVLPYFSVNVQILGKNQVVQEGPLLVAANHVGAYDALALLANIPRPDLSMVVSDTRILRSLTAANDHFIFVPRETSGRMAVLRECIQHLKSGGALLIFPRGEVEPDPGFMPGAEDSLVNWSNSIEIMLRKVPETLLQIAIVSGILLPKFINSPLTRLRCTLPARQKLGEFLQVIQQMIFPTTVAVNPRVSFSDPVLITDLGEVNIMAGIRRIACQVLIEHKVSMAKGYLSSEMQARNTSTT